MTTSDVSELQQLNAALNSQAQSLSAQAEAINTQAAAISELAAQLSVLAGGVYQLIEQIADEEDLGDDPVVPPTL